MQDLVIPIIYLFSAVFFILGLRQLSHPRTALKGNSTASIGMLLAIVATLLNNQILDFQSIFIAILIGSAIGAILAKRVEMTSMPQLVALFNGFGGAASALVASAEFFKTLTSTQEPTVFLILTITLSVLVGTLTFRGSFIAFGKLQGLVTTKPVTFPGQQILNAVLAIIMFIAAYMMPSYGINSFYEIRVAFA